MFHGRCSPGEDFRNLAQRSRLLMQGAAIQAQHCGGVHSMWLGWFEAGQGRVWHLSALPPAAGSAPRESLPPTPGLLHVMLGLPAVMYYAGEDVVSCQ